MTASQWFVISISERFNLDVDPYGLAFGTIQRGADACRIPFTDGSLDVIVLFATLHHFPNISDLLSAWRRKLAPGGMIYALCEPVGCVRREDLPDTFRQELIDGICEQAFLPWEWRQLAQRAGFSVRDAVLDAGSLKMALSPV